MKKILVLFVAMATFSKLNAQTLVALQHSGTTTFYNGVNGFISAYTAATDGDTIYLPGGFYSSTTINKQLVIFGAGHYPDSTLATEKTIFTSGITLGENADNLRIEGVQINGDILYNNNAAVNNVTIKRCRVNSINFQGNLSNPCVNNFIIQNVIDGWIYGENAQSLLVSNNIIAGKMINMNTNVIQNNILFADFYTPYPYYSTVTMINFNNTIVKNNIIFSSEVNFISGTGNFVKNNIFKMVWVVGSNVANGNYNSVDLTTLFINQTGNSFDYSHNYNLVSPSTYVGDDATQIGIYGGTWGYTAGAVPQNPHIISKSISQQTNSSGQLNINIKVKAQ